MAPTRHNHGFVLVLVLVLLAIAALAVAATVRQSLAQVQRATDMTREAQRRWGCLSIERTVLAAAEKILLAHESAQRRSTATVIHRLKLGDVEFELQLGDEQAKINVNQLLRSGDLIAAQRRLRELLAGTGLTARVRLRPVIGPSKSAGIVAGYGQVLENISGAELLDQTHGTPCAAARMTCWGDGRVNVHRADAVTLRSLLETTVGLARLQEILTLRQHVPRPSLAQMLAQLDLNDSQKREAESLLTDRSGCYSVWSVTRAGGQPRYRLAVSSGGKDNIAVFEW
jgi:type II secretory pathway component PulK